MSYIIKDGDGNPVVIKDVEVLGSDKVGIVKEVNLDRRTMTMIGTDESVDRDGDIISSSGWMFENYKKNPVFLWGHQHRMPPLAAATKLIRKRTEDKPTEFTLRFSTEGVNPFADMILQLYHQRVMNASSVGFLPFKWDELGKKEDDPPHFWNPKKFLKQELLELSAVSVPANPSAIQNALKALDASDTIKDLAYNHIIGVKNYGFSNSQLGRITDDIGEITAKGVEVEEEGEIQVQVSADIAPKADVIAATEATTDEVILDTTEGEDVDIEAEVGQAIDVLNTAHEAGYAIEGWIKADARLSGSKLAALKDAIALIHEVLDSAIPKEQNRAEHALDNGPSADANGVNLELYAEELRPDHDGDDGDGMSKEDILGITQQLKSLVDSFG